MLPDPLDHFYAQAQASVRTWTTAVCPPPRHGGAPRCRAELEIDSAFASVLWRLSPVRFVRSYPSGLGSRRSMSGGNPTSRPTSCGRCGPRRAVGGLGGSCRRWRRGVCRPPPHADAAARCAGRADRDRRGGSGRRQGAVGGARLRACSAASGTGVMGGDNDRDPRARRRRVAGPRRRLLRSGQLRGHRRRPWCGVKSGTERRC